MADRDADAGDLSSALRRSKRGGFKAERAEVVVHGLCARCAAEAAKVA